jgi:hypothetical protein
MSSLPPDSSSQTGRKALIGPEMPPLGPESRVSTVMLTPSNGFSSGPKRVPSSSWVAVMTALS